MFKIIGFIVVSSGLLACGTSPCKDTDSSNGQCLASSSDQSNQQAKSKEGPSKAGGYLEGYVASAFQMTVDGNTYADSEAFYTHQLDTLATQVAEQGYDGYSMEFDAQIGLNDLKYGMQVYVVAEGGSGFAGDTRVNESGRFSMAIPDGEGAHVFKVRTNKRVAVLLTSPDKKEKVQMCYNFSGVETTASLTNKVIISNFVTQLTKYACSSAPNGGIVIPSNPAKKAATTTDKAASNEVAPNE